MPVAALLLFTIAVIWWLSAIAVVVPDIAQIVNIALLLFMFVSPIGFSLDLVPRQARVLVMMNPMSYLIEAFRFALIGVRVTPVWYDGVFLIASVLLAAIAGAFFRRMSPIFSDYE